MYKDIKKAIASAKPRQRAATFHFQVLQNANNLQSENPKTFCDEVGVSDGYRREFVKMLALARLMSENGKHIV